MSGGWGGAPWGAGAWGGSPGVLALVTAQAFRENVVRVDFGTAVYFSGVLDPPDASVAAKYVVVADPTSTGQDGNPARAVSVVRATLPTEVDGVEPASVGAFVDLTLDRPMSPFPARYVLTVAGIFSANLSAAIASASTQVDAVYRQLQEPSVEATIPSRDVASPQTRQAMLDPLPDPDNELNLATFVVNVDGDYAYDEGVTNLKKRIYRRLVTSPGGFAHLPEYGVGVPQQGKKLALASTISQLAGEAERQIGLEPDVDKVRVRTIVDPNNPGFVTFQVLVRSKSGSAQRFDVPFPIR